MPDTGESAEPVPVAIGQIDRGDHPRTEPHGSAVAGPPDHRVNSVL